MKKKADAMVLASFAADALALGAHWIYDTAVIDTELGRVDRLRKPAPDSFHDPKEAGEFTHYGDQTLVLLSSRLRKPGWSSPARSCVPWEPGPISGKWPCSPVRRVRPTSSLAHRRSPSN